MNEKDRPDDHAGGRGLSCCSYALSVSSCSVVRISGFHGFLSVAWLFLSSPRDSVSNGEGGGVDQLVNTAVDRKGGNTILILYPASLREDLLLSVNDLVRCGHRERLSPDGTSNYRFH